MRTPWPPDFPLVQVLAPWKGGPISLSDFTGYFRAKMERDVDAALEICEALHNDEVLDYLSELGDAYHPQIPKIVSPGLTLATSRNALARVYMSYLAQELYWETSDGFFQTTSGRRDFETDGWYRIAYDPEFYGAVEEGKPYLIADDVMTMGGTVASLRGFIESKGGFVIGVTALACGNGSHAKISLADETLNQLRLISNGALEGAIREELGYGIECLTEPEGRFLLRTCPSVDVFRDGIHGARNAGA